MPDIIIAEKFMMTIQQEEHEDYTGRNLELREHALHDGLLEFVGRICGRYTKTEAERQLLEHSLALWFVDTFRLRARQRALGECLAERLKNPDGSPVR